MTLKAQFYFYFTESGKKDKFPCLAAFGTLNKRQGDEITADYLKLIQKYSAYLNKRKEHKTERGNP